MRSSVCPALTTAAIVPGLSTDHDRRGGQRCTVLTHPVSLIHRGISVQINRATSQRQWQRSFPPAHTYPNSLTLSGKYLSSLLGRFVALYVTEAVN